MSITHAQLREFAHASDPQTPGRVSRETSRLLLELGLFDKNGITPAGHDALATVPYLVDVEPVEEYPTTPETVECGACDGAGVRRTVHVFEVRDHAKGKLTQHTRSNLVVCNAKGCERGRVTAVKRTIARGVLGGEIKIVDGHMRFQWPTEHDTKPADAIGKTPSRRNAKETPTSTPTYSNEMLERAASSTYFRVTENGAIKLGFGKYAGKNLRTIPLEYIEWCITASFEKDATRIWCLELQRREQADS